MKSASKRDTGLCPQLAETERFLEALAPGETEFTFQVFDDRNPARKGFAGYRHGTLQQHEAWLTSMNNKGAGVFVMVNAGDGKGRSRVNVEQVRAVFVDLDGAPLDPALSEWHEPHIVVNSSPDRWHVYWLADGLDRDCFSDCQKELIQKFGADPKIHDLPRVMRLPGFYHRKSSSLHLVTLKEAKNHEPYNFSKVRPKKQTSPPPAVRREKSYADGGRNNALTSEAGRLRNTGLSYEELDAALQEMNLQRCMPPLDRAEVSSIARSVSRYEVITPDGEVTETYLAEKFYEENGNRWRYCKELNSWFYWDGATWTRDRITAAYDAIRQICKATATACPKKAVTLGKSSTIAGVERISKALPGFATRSEDWDSHPMLLNTPAGAVDLTTGVINEPNPELLLSKKTRVIPSDEMRCPLWLNFVNECTNGDAELAAYLQKIAGYWLTGLTTEHSLFFIYGDGGNGKSVFLNTISNMLGIGDYSAVASAETFVETKNTKHLSELAVLKGSRLVSATETDEGKRWAEARIKSITGGDPITANLMRQNPFTFTPQLKLVIVGNHKPKISNPDDAMKRRIKIIPFVHKPKTIDPQLSEKLEEEAPGILRWAIEGTLLWQKESLEAPGAVKAATNEYFEEEDSIGLWMDERVEFDSSGFESSSDLFQDWNQWAMGNNEWVGDKKRFVQALARRGLSAYRNKDARGFKGVKLKPTHHPEFSTVDDFLAH